MFEFRGMEGRQALSRAAGRGSSGQVNGFKLWMSAEISEGVGKVENW